MAVGLDAQLVHRLVGDRGGDDLAVADIDADVRGGRALLYVDDDAFELVTCTDAHGGSHTIQPRADLAHVPAGSLIEMKGWDRRPYGPRAYGATTGKLSAHRSCGESPIEEI